MSSPNEPGNGNAPSPSGPAPDRGELPPWERSASSRSPRASSRRPETTSGPHPAPTLDERINRFISGPSASGPAPEPPAPTRTEAPVTTRTDALRSELPDLSAPSGRPPRRKLTTGRPPAEAPSRASRMEVGTRTSGPVRATMQIRRVDPWSVLKVSLVLSVALFFVWMIAVAFLYLVLGGMGVWAKLNSNVGDLLNNTSSSELVSSGTIFGSAALIGLVNIVLLTAMATVGAFIYNLTTDLVGGVEVTLADRD
ncbi:MAG: DUF3566 domain-containing protein [Mycobacteriaceae bacterium]|nr:DUF3566 domain-containing protein [Mycobacteriaceae bacterium]